MVCLSNQILNQLFEMEWDWGMFSFDYLAWFRISFINSFIRPAVISPVYPSLLRDRLSTLCNQDIPGMLIIHVY